MDREDKLILGGFAAVLGAVCGGVLTTILYGDPASGAKAGFALAKTATGGGSDGNAGDFTDFMTG